MKLDVGHVTNFGKMGYEWTQCDQSSTGQVLKEKCDFLRPPILPLLRARNVNMSVCFGPEDKSHMREAAEPA